MMIARSILIAIIVLALIGAVDSGYALYQHYNEDPDAACNMNETVNCSTVNNSEYAKVLGVPVAGIGLAGYIFFAGICGLMLAGNYLRGFAIPLLLAAAAFAFIYSSYLTYIEFVVLEAVCPMCVISMTVVTVITILAFVGAWRGRSRSNLQPLAD